mgnify:CR=1 FL=1
MKNKILPGLCALLLSLLFIVPAYAQKSDLRSFLTKEGYIAIKLNKLLIGHLYLEGTLNGVKGKFILDSGAGATVIDETVKDKFKLNTDKGGDIPAAGAGSASLTAKMVAGNTLVLGNYKRGDFSLAVMNLDHVNNALKAVGISPFDGVIGADILSSGKAVIDYATLTLYLQNIAH